MQSNSQLQKEQTQLLEIQKKLLALLPIAQEALNGLKVEEFQLKSQALEDSQNRTALVSEPTISSDNSYASQKTTQIIQSGFDELLNLELDQILQEELDSD